MTEETFVSHGRYAWLWFCVFSVLAMTGIYMLDDPIGGPNGGTVLGYTYGGIAAAGIVFLMWYGIRKRHSYFAHYSTLKGWLAAHVWIGVALAFIVPLHCGFSFGINVHTLAYVLMLLTIISGIWGAIYYVKLPEKMTARRDGLTLKSCLEQIDVIANDIDNMASGKSEAFSKLLNKLDFAFKPSAIRSLLGYRVEEVPRAQLSGFLSALPKEEYDPGLKMISLAHRKVQICNQLLDETRKSSLLKIWLYFHLPISFGCVAALAIHIVAVFYYW